MRTSKFSRVSETTGTATISSRMREARPTTPGPVKPYGPRQTGDSVVFVAFCPQATTVQIAGDFNGWQPEKTPMAKAGGDGTWQARVPLAKGVYKYRLVVDGHWQHDPHNDMTEPNPYSELNSVLKVN